MSSRRKTSLSMAEQVEVTGSRAAATPSTNPLVIWWHVTEAKLLAIPAVQRAVAWLGWPVRAIRTLCLWVGAVVLCTGLLLSIGLFHFFKSLPQLHSLSFEEVQKTAVTRTQARLENPKAFYRWTPLHEISRPFIYSVISSEDSTFFEHDGFNLEAIVDSLAENIREGKNSYGASTISQQVSKNLFLTSEKSWIRKAKEFFVTRNLERRFKKNEILELYLNIAEFGPDIYGVAAASKAYFGLEPSQINAAEGCFMALMLPSPRRHFFSVFENENLSRPKRRRLERVLRGMLYEEFITEAQYRSYTNYDFFSFKHTGEPRVVSLGDEPIAAKSSRKSKKRR